MGYESLRVAPMGTMTDLDEPSLAWVQGDESLLPAKGLADVDVQV